MWWKSFSVVPWQARLFSWMVERERERDRERETDRQTEKRERDPYTHIHTHTQRVNNTNFYSLNPPGAQLHHSLPLYNILTKFTTASKCDIGSTPQKQTKFLYQDIYGPKVNSSTSLYSSCCIALKSNHSLSRNSIRSYTTKSKISSFRAWNWQFVCWLLAKRCSNMLAYLIDTDAQATVHAATLRQKLQIKLSISPSHSADPIKPGAWQSSHCSSPNFWGKRCGILKFNVGSLAPYGK